jgi:TRAP-type mannitol/chloroaromatic compound transport system permease large subunit
VSDEELNMPLADKLRLLRAGLIPFLIFFFMTGLFLMGITSLVESSAVGAAAATAAALWKRRLTRAVLHGAVRNTLLVSCMFLWIILAALAFGAIFDGIGAVRAIESLFITTWELSPWEVLLMMQLSFLIMGMFLDDTAMLVIVAPLYVPLVKSLDLGIDNVLIWYGVLYTITCQIAYLTPPFGYNLFLMRGLAPKEIQLGDIYRSVTPFVLIMIAAALLITVFPQIALWLPAHMTLR